MTNPSILLHERVSPFGNARVYEVGGAVRDRALGREATDLDYVVCGLPPESFSTVFMFDKVDYVGQAFGVYKIQLHELGKPLGPVLDVALPRTEFSTGAGHTNFSVEVSHQLPIETDLSRRDFTMNAMAFDVREQELVDPFGGLDDIRERRIRFVGDALQRIEEDPLRILRAFRFSVQLGFSLSIGMPSVIGSTAQLLGELSAERIWAELWKLLSVPNANPWHLRRVLRVMLNCGVLREIIPDYSEADGYDQGTPYHNLDLADHMLSAVAHAQNIGAAPVAKLALLLHDLGKLNTRSEGDDGKAHYYGHEQVGAEMAGQILSALRAPTQVIADVQTLISHHMRLSPKHPLGTKGVRRFMADLGPLWKESLYHRYADLMAHAPGLHTTRPEQWLLDMIDQCQAQPAETATLSDHTLALSGKDIMALLGLKPGKEVGVIKQALLQEVIDGDLPNERPPLIERLKELYV